MHVKAHAGHLPGFHGWQSSAVLPRRGSHTCGEHTVVQKMSLPVSNTHTHTPSHQKWLSLAFCCQLSRCVNGRGRFGDRLLKVTQAPFLSGSPGSGLVACLRRAGKRALKCMQCTWAFCKVLPQCLQCDR